MNDKTDENDLVAMSTRIYGEWEKGMTRAWEQVLDTPDFARASGLGLTAWARWRGAWQDQVDAAMHDLHLPALRDIQRIGSMQAQLDERSLAMEDRLLAMEDRLVAMEDQLTSVAGQLGALCRLAEGERRARSARLVRQEGAS